MTIQLSKELEDAIEYVYNHFESIESVRHIEQLVKEYLKNKIEENEM